MKKSHLLVLPALALGLSTAFTGTATAAQPVGGATYEPPAKTEFGEAAVTLVVNEKATTVRGKVTDNCNVTYKVTAVRIADSGAFKATGTTTNGGKITLKGKFTSRNRASGTFATDACDVPEGTFTSLRTR